MSDSLFEQLAGWRPGSNMKQKYIHLHGNESANAMLKLRGLSLTPMEEADKQQAALVNNRLGPKSCPSCNEVNEATARFCTNPKYGIVLSFDNYKATTKGAKEEKKRLEVLEAKQEILEANTANLVLAMTDREFGVESWAQII